MLSPESMGLVKRGRLVRLHHGKDVGAVNVGEFFGEEKAVFWVPSRTVLKAAEETETLVLPATLVAGIPSVRWRLFEEWGRRINFYGDEPETELSSKTG